MLMGNLRHKESVTMKKKFDKLMNFSNFWSAYIIALSSPLTLEYDCSDGVVFLAVQLMSTSLPNCIWLNIALSPNDE